MSLNIRCPVCDELLAASYEGRHAHMLKHHGIRLKPDRFIPMDAMKKAAIVYRVEERLGQRIIKPSPIRRCNKCGPTKQEGYWLIDGSGICEPCAKNL
jgi:hypothetical protein